MGPTSTIQLEGADSATCDAVDATLAALPDTQVERNRKGRVWQLWVRGRPVSVELLIPDAMVELAAGCNDPEDYKILRAIAASITAAVGGYVSEPNK